MSRAAQRFRQSDVVKAVKAALAAGVSVSRVEISPDGTIIVIAGRPEEGQNSVPEANEWDAVA